MATLRKRANGVYQARWYVSVVDEDGTLKRKREERSTGYRDRAMARKAARRFELQSLEIAQGPAPLPLDVAIAQYLGHLEALRRADDTLAYYRRKAKHLMRVFGPATDVHQLGPADATRYMHTRLTEAVRGKRESKGGSEIVTGGADEGDRKVGVHSVSKELGALRAVLRWHATQQRFHGRTDWCVPGELRGAYKPRERALSQDEYHELHGALELERKDFLALFVGVGVRDSELYGIEARDIDAKAQRLHIRGTKTKRADRWVPLRPELLKILKRRAANTPKGSLFPRWKNVRRDLHAACKRAEIAPVSPNDLRRTFASWHADAGTPELVVVQLMGHSSSEMVRRVYARTGSVAQSDAAARFPALQKPKKRVAKKAPKKTSKKKGAKR